MNRTQIKESIHEKIGSCDDGYLSYGSLGSNNERYHRECEDQTRE